MASGDGLPLFFNTNRLPCGPLPPPPPEIGPPPPISTSIVGLGPYISGGEPNPTILPSLTGCQVGDILVANMAYWLCGAGCSMVGRLPAGWSLTREDITGNLYTGVAVKVAVTNDTIANASDYSFASPYFAGSGAGAPFLGVAIACVHNSSGIDRITYSASANPPSGYLTTAGVFCTNGPEIVLVLASAGTNAGATYVCAGTTPASVAVNNIAVATQQGFTDSANRIFYFNGPVTPGVSASQSLVSSSYSPSPGYPYQSIAGYQISMLP